MVSDTPKKQDKIYLLLISLTIIVTFLYLALRDNSIHKKDLSSVVVTIQDTLRYDTFKIKSTTYREIVFKTHEYQKDFRITGMTFQATDHRLLKSSVFIGDTLTFQVKSEDIDKLNNETHVNNYNDLYGVNKKGASYVDLDLRQKLKTADSRWAYGFVIFGFIMFIYGLTKIRSK